MRNITLRLLRKIGPSITFFEATLALVLTIVFLFVVRLSIDGPIELHGLIVAALLVLVFVFFFPISIGIIEYIQDHDKPELTEEELERIVGRFREIRDGSSNKLDGEVAAIEWRQYEEKKFKRDPDNNWESYYLR